MTSPKLRPLLGLLILLPLLATARSGDSDALWAALRDGGHVVLIRHALAPGTGDPDDFRLDDCATQRNLSEPGREQARRIGRLFRDRGVAVARVLSSRWCRCLETARLLELGPVEPFPALDSFFGRREAGPAQTAALRAFVSEPRPGAALVLVTHQVNISALTGVYPASGEMVVLRPQGNGDFQVLGRIATAP